MRAESALPGAAPGGPVMFDLVDSATVRHVLAVVWACPVCEVCKDPRHEGRRETYHRILRWEHSHKKGWVNTAERRASGEEVEYFRLVQMGVRTGGSGG